jgi:hypothetical protein
MSADILTELRSFADGLRANAQKDYVNLAEIAEATETTIDTVYQRVRRKKIPYVKVRDEETGRRLVVLEREDAKRLIETLFGADQPHSQKRKEQ